MPLHSKEAIGCNGAIKLWKPLPPKTLWRLMRLVQREIDLIQATYDTPEIRTDFIDDPQSWTLKDRVGVLPFKTQNIIRNYLKKLGYGLSIEFLARNEIIRFGHVIKHDDSHLERNGSTLFIPLILPRNEEVNFWHASNPERVYPLSVWDIMIFDQNQEHALDLKMKESDKHMGYGLVLFLDRLPSKESVK